MVLVGALIKISSKHICTRAYVNDFDRAFNEDLFGALVAKEQAPGAEYGGGTGNDSHPALRDLILTSAHRSVIGIGYCSLCTGRAFYSKLLPLASAGGSLRFDVTLSSFPVGRNQEFGEQYRRLCALGS
jgi:hypothetical protein